MTLLVKSILSDIFTHRQPWWRSGLVFNKSTKNRPKSTTGWRFQKKRRDSDNEDEDLSRNPFAILRSRPSTPTNAECTTLRTAPKSRTAFLGMKGSYIIQTQPLLSVAESTTSEEEEFWKGADLPPPSGSPVAPGLKKSSGTATSTFFNASQYDDIPGFPTQCPSSAYYGVRRINRPSLGASIAGGGSLAVVASIGGEKDHTDNPDIVSDEGAPEIFARSLDGGKKPFIFGHIMSAIGARFGSGGLRRKKYVDKEDSCRLTLG